MIETSINSLISFQISVDKGLFLILASITAKLDENHDKTLKIVFTVITWFELSVLWMCMSSISIWFTLSFNEHEPIPDANNNSNATDFSAIASTKSCR